MTWDHLELMSGSLYSRRIKGIPFYFIIIIFFYIYKNFYLLSKTIIDWLYALMIEL